MHESLKKISPLTIIADRYSGCYSNGEYLAFNLEYDNLPDEVYGDDSTCQNFWEFPETRDEWARDLEIGLGDTPDNALIDLSNKMEMKAGKYILAEFKKLSEPN